MLPTYCNKMETKRKREKGTTIALALADPNCISTSLFFQIFEWSFTNTLSRGRFAESVEQKSLDLIDPAAIVNLV